jgi:hypothetical protein
MSDVGISASKALTLTTRSPVARAAATNNYYVTVWYTKA